jgi:hypothetical protein
LANWLPTSFPAEKIHGLILQYTYLSIPVLSTSWAGQDEHSGQALRQLAIISSHPESILPDITPMFTFYSAGDHQ